MISCPARPNRPSDSSTSTPGRAHRRVLITDALIAATMEHRCRYGVVAGWCWCGGGGGWGGWGVGGGGWGGGGAGWRGGGDGGGDAALQWPVMTLRWRGVDLFVTFA